MRAAIAGLALIAGSIAGSTPARAVEWRPEDTTALVISVVTWPAKAGLDAFDAKARPEAALIATLKRRGVPASRITTLLDAQATAPAARQAIARVAAAARPGSMLLVVLQAHGVKVDHDTCLALHDFDERRAGATTLKVREIGDIIATTWRGGSLLVVGDFCYAGAVAQIAGRVNARGRGGVAALASATDSDRATDRFTFLEAFTEALAGHGEADEDGDGAITFRELTAWVIGAMVHGESQMAEATLAGGFPFDQVMARVPAGEGRQLAPDGRRAGTGVEALDSDGDWFPGRLLRYRDGKWQVRFSGCGPEDDEWCGPERLRAPSKSPWRVGYPAEVEWGPGEWYAARVTAIAGGRMHLVHYDGTDGEDDDWVPAIRMRHPNSGPLADGPDGPPRRSKGRARRKKP